MPGFDAYVADDSIWFYKVLTPYNGHAKGIYVYSNISMKQHVGKIILKPSSSKLFKFKHLPEGGFGHMVDAAVPFYKWDGKTSGVPIVTDSTWYADINKLYKVEDLDFFAASNINSPEEIAHIAYGADGYPDTATYTKDDYTIETRKDLEDNEYMVFTTPINGSYGVTERVIILIAFSTIYLYSWNADASQYGRMEFEPGLYLRYGDGTYVTTIYK
jgi:hypothetical protein